MRSSPVTRPRGLRTSASKIDGTWNTASSADSSPAAGLPGSVSAVTATDASRTYPLMVPDSGHVLTGRGQVLGHGAQHGRIARLLQQDQGPPEPERGFQRRRIRVEPPDPGVLPPGQRPQRGELAAVPAPQSR